MTEGMIKGIRGGKRGKQEEKAHLLCSVRVVPGNKKKQIFNTKRREIKERKRPESIIRNPLA